VSADSLRQAVPQLDEFLRDFDAEIIENAEIGLKYESYIVKEKEMADKMHRLEDLQLGSFFDYSKLSALSMEARLKLAKVQPQTLGQASRISGVSPSDISVLLIHAGR
jgi:tRNA uridine 5-carboxymethylaminomethyl modification enzyme